MQPLTFPKVLAALYNASFTPCSYEPSSASSPLRLSEAQAEAILYEKYNYDPTSAATVRIEQLFGRPIYVDLTYDGVDPREYDSMNGGKGTLTKVLKSLSFSNNVSSPFIVMIHQTNMLQCCTDRKQDGDLLVGKS